MRLIAACLLASLSVAASAAQCEVVLANGDVVRGELIAESRDVITVQRTIQGKNGPIKAKVNYTRDKIVKLTKDLPEEVTPEQEYATRAKATADLADDQLALAKWCQEKRLKAQAIVHVNRVFKLDPEHAGAHRLVADLGCVEVDGVWVDGADVVDTAESERKKADAQAKREAWAAGKTLEEKQRALEKAREKLKAAKAAIQKGEDDVRTGESRLSSLEQDERWAKERVERARTEANRPNSRQDREWAKYHDDQVAEATVEMRKIQAERQTVATKLKQAQRALETAKADRERCEEMVPKLERELGIEPSDEERRR